MTGKFRNQYIERKWFDSRRLRTTSHRPTEAGVIFNIITTVCERRERLSSIRMQLTHRHLKFRHSVLPQTHYQVLRQPTDRSFLQSLPEIGGSSQI